MSQDRTPTGRNRAVVILILVVITDLIAIAAAVAYLLHKPFPGALWMWFLPAFLMIVVKYLGPRR